MIIIGSALDAELARMPLNVRAVLNVAEEVPQIHYASILSVKIPLLDRLCEDASLAPINSDEQVVMAARVLDLLWQDAATKEMSVLVHCRNGLSRAPTVVACWHMLFGARLTADEALAHVRVERAIALGDMQKTLPLVQCPHPSFVAQLKWIEEVSRHATY